MAGLLRRWRERRWSPDAVLEARLAMVRFRHLLDCHGRMVRLAEDATEKQSGGFVLDRQYVLDVAQQASEIADAAVFDLNALTAGRHLGLYDALERAGAGIERALARPGEEERRAEPRPAAAARPDPEALAAAIAAAPLLADGEGRVACHGVAAGPVHNLEVEGGLPPAGSVVVGRDIHAGEALLGAVGAAAAVVLERGSPASEIASLAREARVPMIVGLSDATRRLVAAGEVTVDADELRVYGARVQELLDYHAAAQLDEEEPEYELLRAVRRAAFPLTLAAPAFAPGAAPTLQDVVQTAREAGSLALGEAVRAAARSAGADHQGARLVELARGGRAGAPLQALLGGVRARPRPLEVAAAATPERLAAVCPAPEGLDVIWAERCPRRGGILYARFGAGGAAAEVAGVRARVAESGLRRLGFDPLRAAGGTAGWAHSLSWGAFEDRLRRLGRVAALLAEVDDDPSAAAVGFDELVGGAL